MVNEQGGITMSQHFAFFEETNQVLMLGWDKPIKEAYLILGNLNNEGDDWEYPLTIDVTNPFDRVVNIHHVDEIAIRFAGKLEEVGVELSKHLRDALIKDISEDSVNQTWLHKANSECTKLDESPFNSGLFSKLAAR